MMVFVMMFVMVFVMVPVIVFTARMMVFVMMTHN